MLTEEQNRLFHESEKQKKTRRNCGRPKNVYSLKWHETMPTPCTFKSMRTIIYRNLIGGEPAAVHLEDSARTKSSLYSFEKRSRNKRRVPHSNQESRTKPVRQSGSPLKQDDELRPAVNIMKDFTAKSEDGKPNMTGNVVAVDLQE